MSTYKSHQTFLIQSSKPQAERAKEHRSALPYLSFRASQEATDIVTMPIGNQACRADGKQRHGSGGMEKPDPQRKAPEGEQGRQRRGPPDGGTGKPHGQQAAPYDPVDGQEHPQGGRHAFASFESQKHGEYVSQDGRTAGAQFPFTACSPDKMPGDQHRQGPLPHVADQRDDPSSFARHPEDVGESDVSTASVAWVDPPQCASCEDADGNGAEEIADRERRGEGRVHQEERACAPLRGSTAVTNCRTYWAAETSESTRDTQRMAMPQEYKFRVLGTASSRINNRIATTWAAILSFPVVSAARTIPSRAATRRKPVTANSRPASTMAIHASTTSWSTRRKRAVRTKSLSAIGSSSLPSLVIWPQRRAM